MTPAIRQALVVGAFAVLCSLTVTFAVSAFTRTPVVVGTPAATTIPSQGSGFQAGIFTTGDATVSARPDTAFISVGVDAQASTAGAAQKGVAAQAARLIAKAKALGVADKDLTTAGYSIGPTYSNGRTITGYMASEQLALKWHNVDTTGSALDALVQDGGATRVGVSFGLADLSGAQALARTLAIAAARGRASAMAKAGDVQLGQIIRIVDYSSGGRTPVVDYSPSAAASAPTQVPVGELDITVSVEVDFAIT